MALEGEAASTGRPTYLLGASLSGGGSGARLIQARHSVFQRDCIQKTVLLRGLADSVFLNEPQLAKALSHPNVAGVWEAQHDPAFPGAVTFTMPLFEGGSVLSALRSNHRFSLQEGVDVAVQVLSALSYLHSEHGFVHRDVKPGNVLLDADRTTGFLSDFGSAGRVDANGQVLVAGFTKPYLDPAARLGHLTPASDQYALGVTLFELLCGELDWSGVRESDVDIRLGKGQRAFPDSALKWAPHVPSSLRRVITRAIKRDPVGRHSSAATMLGALRQLQLIDWRHETGSDLVGEWYGSWPPRRPKGDRRLYKVESSSIASGKDAGRLLLIATYSADGRASRRFGVADARVSPSDRKAVAQFFSNVEAAVRHNRSAR